MKIGYVQNSPIFGNKQKNLNSIDDLLTGVKADLIVLPTCLQPGMHLLYKQLV
jgi:predicted amidohydrolase